MNRINFWNIPALCVAALLTLYACSLGEPLMEPLTESRLDEAERQWKARRSDSYHLVVQVEASRMDTLVYDIQVRGGEIAGIKKNGQAIQPEHTEDYSISGLFRLMRLELTLRQKSPEGTPEALAELFAHFDQETGRLTRYRRSASGSRRTRTLKIQILNYEPDTAGLKT